MFGKVGQSLLRLLRPREVAAEAPHSGSPTALDGATAVAVVETFLAESACFGATGSDSAAAMERVWREQWAREGINLLGQALGGVPGHGPRAAVAAALGLTLSGRRAAVFLSGAELAAVTDLVAAAVGRRAPLVLHVVHRSWSAHGAATGSGHEAWHALADTGAVLLQAADVQQAVDLTLLGRRLAEQALVPVLIGMDEAETATSVQQLELPGAALIRDWLGAPEDEVDCPTPAQQMLFGPRRARLPRWYDHERPALLGAHQPPETWALGAAAGVAFFGAHVEGLLEAAASELRQRTGREWSRVSTWDLQKAEVVLLAQGSLVEVARATALALRAARGPRVGVVGLAGLRPLPVARLRQELNGARVVVVLERCASPLADPPLLRELRGALGASAPRLVSALAGLGGLPVRAADLAALCRELQTGTGGRERVWLGLDFHHARDPWPKRQVTMDALRRLYPEVTGLGLRADEPLDARPGGALTVEVHRGASDRVVAEGLADRVAALLRELADGALRTRAGRDAQLWDGPRVDRLTWAPAAFPDPGDDTPCELVVLAGARPDALGHALARLRDGGVVLVHARPELPAGLAQALAGRDVRVHSVELDEDEETAREQLLGATLALALELRRLEPSARRLLEARRRLYDGQSVPEERLSAFQAGLSLAKAADEVATPPLHPGDSPLPLVIRHFRRTDRTWDNVPLFWDQVGAVWRSGGPDQLVADPYMATGALPPLTSTFRELSGARTTLPAWKPQACTGCGDCWTACPEGAVGPLVLGADAILGAGMALAASAGTRADALQPLLKTLGARLTRELRGGAPGFGAALDAAGAWVMEKGGLNAERQQAVSAALGAVRAQLEHLPVALTAPFHDEPEAARKGDGELLIIAINPDTCKGCRACAAACADAAMVIEPQTEVRLSEARAQWSTWERLPDTSGRTVAAASQHPVLGPLAGALLSRAALLAMVGGDGAEAGSGERLAVRAVLALLEAELQPGLVRHVQDLRALRERVDEALHARLSKALPTGDLGALEEALRGLGSEAGLGEILARAPAAGRKLDADDVRRLVMVGRQLDDLIQRLEKGKDGLGRARAGLTLAGDTVSAWAGAFPHNPFTCPVVVDLSGEAGATARGLAEAATRATVDALRLVAQARAALGDKVSVPARWQDLGPAERALCPPVVLVGTDRAMMGDGFGRIAALLGADLPVKILLLAELDFGLHAPLDLPPDDPPGELSLLALGHRRALVAQSSVGADEHLARCLSAALRWPGPALLRVSAPSPGRHGYATADTVARAREAVGSRALPLFLLRPGEPGVFGSRLELEGNPTPERVVPLDRAGHPRTLADWALGETRFAAHFTPCSGGRPLAEGMDGGEGPFVIDGPQGPLRVSPALLAASRERARTWRTLQELAGLESPFVAPIRAAAQAAVQAERQSELAALRAQHAAELEALRGQVLGETAERVRQRLLQLAGYPGGGRGGEA